MADTGWIIAGTGSNIDDGGDEAWNNPVRITADDTLYANSNPNKNKVTQVLRGTNFDFSGLPDGATIDGIELNTYAAAAGGGGSKPFTVNIGKDGSTLATSKNDTLGGVITDYINGGPTDLWGLSWTAADIKSSSFLGQFKGTDDYDYDVDFIAIRVYYTETAPDLTQVHYRFHEDASDADSNPAFIAAEDTAAIVRDLNTPFWLRIGVQNEGGDHDGADLLEVRHQKNGVGIYGPIITGDFQFRVGNSSHFTGRTTLSTGDFALTAGAGMATAGVIIDNTNDDFNADIGGGEYSELMICLEFRSESPPSSGDYWDIQLKYQSSGDDIDTYDVTARVYYQPAVEIDTDLDALLTKEGESETTALDAHLAKTESETTDLDAQLTKVESEALSLDALAQMQESLVAGLDALASKGGLTVQTDLDANATKQDLAEATDLDAQLYKQGTVVSDLDALARKQGLTANVDLDALAAKRESIAAALDALARKTASVAAGLDANALKLNEIVATTLDAQATKHQTLSVSLGALLSKGVVLSSDLDALLEATVTEDTSLDALAAKQDNLVGASLDSVLVAGLATYTVTNDLDALLVASGALEISLDALLRKTGVPITASLEALLDKSGLTELVGLDALVKRFNVTASTSIEALLNKQGAETVTLGALLSKVGMVSADLDAVVFNLTILQTSLDANIATRATRSVALDAWLRREWAPNVSNARIGAVGEFSMGQQSRWAVPAIFTTLDGIVGKAYTVPPITVDALLLQTVALQASLDAVLAAQPVVTTDLDAALRKTLALTASLDGVLRQFGFETTSLDALVTATASVSAQLDSILSMAMTGEISLDAVLFKSAATVSIALDAALTGAFNTVASQIDAIMGRKVAFNVAFDAMLDKILNAPKSRTIYVGKERREVHVHPDRRDINVRRGRRSIKVRKDRRDIE